MTVDISCHHCGRHSPIPKEPGFTKKLEALGWDCTKNRYGRRYYCPDCVRLVFGDVMDLMTANDGGTKQINGSKP